MSTRRSGWSVTATNAGGSTAATSAADGCGRRQRRAPTNTALPTITGTAAVGSMLTASTGGWDGSPTGYAYQWQRCDAAGANCSPVGTDSATYPLVAGDLGKTIRVVVTASNDIGPSAPATSTQTGVVQASAPPPATLGKTTAGALTHTLGGGYLEVSGRYTLASSSR